MATPEDEFDPHWSLLEAIVEEILTPALARTSNQIGKPFVARVAVWVRDTEIPKFSLSPTDRGHYDVEENTDVRIRFRQTIKATRHLFSIQVQHAEAWRQQKLSGIWIKGDVDIAQKVPIFRVRDETIRYTGEWKKW
ncbi:hypothetical protein Pan241w_41600 [Gimesia alba]|uniref:Uncharacterized protein n=1 Tax=Gimesia alba TaxID=2527973 RepID=A0A517RJJ7_9PLAN|nr:hypothetical protein [Gimesia alba]QDT44055.1 hypothetical protein Pan241w_41600 [Gimesia alba]